MSMITFAYVFLMIAGIIWVILSFRRFMQSERERDSHTLMAEIRMEKDFKAYLESLARQKAAADGHNARSHGEGKPWTQDGSPPIA